MFKKKGSSYAESLIINYERFLSEPKCNSVIFYSEYIMSDSPNLPLGYLKNRRASGVAEVTPIPSIPNSEGVIDLNFLLLSCSSDFGRFS